MKRIELTKGKYAIVDDDMYEILSQYSWFAREDYKYYAARTCNKPKVITEYMHWYVAGKPKKGFVTDHINGNGLDNRRENLRTVTFRVNMQNRYRKPGRMVGTVPSKSNNWSSRIFMHGKILHLGTFKTQEEAHRAYMNKANEIDFPQELK